MQSHIPLLLMFRMWLLILEQRETVKDHSRATKVQQNMYTIPIGILHYKECAKKALKHQRMTITRTIETNQ